MALTTYFKADNTTALNLAASWTASPAGPPPAATTSQARWDSTVTVARAATLGASTTWGQIVVVNPGGACGITVSAGTTLTLTPTDAVAAGVGIDMFAATQGFSIAGPIALGSSQEWKVAANRTLTVGGIVSGAFSLSKTNPGTLALSAASTFGGAGQTFAVNAGQVTASNANALGSSLNAIAVASGANLTVSAAIAQTALTVSGAGFTGGTGYGAFTTTNALTSSQVITLGASGTVLTINASTFAAQIATSPGVTSLTLNMVGANLVTFGTTSTYTVSGGVRIKSLATNGTTPNSGRYSFGTGNPTDGNTSGGKGLGANTNSVIVEQTGAIDSPGTTGGTTTLSRSYEFLASTSPTVRQASTGASGSVITIIDFQGPVTFTGTAGQASSFAGGNLTNYRFSSTVSGAADLWCGTKGGFLASSVGIAATTDMSSWTGTIYTDDINYYGTPLSTLPSLFLSRTTSFTFINAIGGTYSASHSSYAKSLAATIIFNATTYGHTAGSLTLEGGAWSSSPGTWQIDGGALTLNFSFNGTTGTLTKSGLFTLVLGGSNTSITSTAWTVGNLTLNSVNAIGDGADAFTVTSTGVLDSTTGAVLAQTGVNALNANFTWRGTAALTFGAGNVTTTTDRTITYAATGETGGLKFSGAITTSLASTSWNFGGATAGAKQRVTLGGANASSSDATATNQHAVTAGYFRIENNNGLGAAGTTTAWWVGATNLGVQTTKAALELAGVTTPDTKNVNLYNIGPNDDGALIGVSGTSVFSGAISVPNVAGTRIGVKSSATLTLLGSGLYQNLNPTNSGTPLAFTAESGGTLNQNRILGSNVSTVTVTGGSGTVVFSRANLHTGAMTCSAGTTKVTDVNATAAGNVTVSAGATLESTVQSHFQSTLSLGTTSFVTRAILKFAA